MIVMERKNKTKYKSFIKICKKSQSELKEYLKKILLKYYDEVIDENGFLYVRQKNTPVLLTAHMDTVHETVVKNFTETIQINPKSKIEHIISSPQGIGGDDRCGVYMILSILKRTKYRPAILFCEEEEKGGIGSDLFCKTQYSKELSKLKFFIELDRANATDLVYYNDDNTDFHNWCSKVTGYKEAYGSFSDISNLCPDTGIAGVNISCGYYKAHTTQEYVVMEEMFNSIEKVKDLLKASANVEPFEYIETYYYSNKWNNYSYWDDDYYNSYNFQPITTKTNELIVYVLYVCYLDRESGVEKEVEIEGNSKEDCWMTFFFNYSNICFNDIIEFTFER